MACRHNQVQPDATRIIWIQFPTFRYKYVQPMANRNNYVQPGVLTNVNIEVTHFMKKEKKQKCF